MAKTIHLIADFPVTVCGKNVLEDSSFPFWSFKREEATCEKCVPPEKDAVEELETPPEDLVALRNAVGYEEMKMASNRNNIAMLTKRRAGLPEEVMTNLKEAVEYAEAAEVRLQWAKDNINWFLERR